MDKINFQDGTKVSSAKVTIDEVDYTVTPARYSGATPLSAFVLNKLQDNIEDGLDELDTKIDSLNELLSSKVDKVAGKSLSTNDFTSGYKTKLDGIATGATKNTVENSLTSTSTTNALSAAQGKSLNDKYNGTNLYNNSSGTTASITLSQSAANFTKIIIYYRDINNVYKSMLVYSPNGKRIELTSLKNGASSLVFYNSIIYINGTSLTWSENKRLSIASGEYVDEKNILIVRIDGYK